MTFEGMLNKISDLMQDVELAFNILHSDYVTLQRKFNILENNYKELEEEIEELRLKNL